MKHGLIVDLETTGLNYKKDTIIEIGLIQFAILENEPPSIRTMYSALSDPETPLSPEIISLTGITDSALKDQSIDWDRVKELFDSSDIAIAHNARFDRNFLMQMPLFENLDIPWACTMEHIDWAKKGFKTRSLNYLAADHGFLNPFSHRALFDCALTFRLLTPYLDELLSRSQEKTFLIQAFDAPFSTKDTLKGRQYRWNKDEKVWQKTIGAKELEEERSFLSTNVYSGIAVHSETEL